MTPEDLRAELDVWIAKEAANKQELFSEGRGYHDGLVTWVRGREQALRDLHDAADLIEHRAKPTDYTKFGFALGEYYGDEVLKFMCLECEGDEFWVGEGDKLTEYLTWCDRHECDE